MNLAVLAHLYFVECQMVNRSGYYEAAAARHELQRYIHAPNSEIFRMLLIIGTVRLPAANLAATRAAMAAMIEASRAETGCLEYTYAEDVLKPGLIHIKERWTDQAVLIQHFQSAHIATWRSSWPLLGIGDRDLTQYEVGEPQTV